MDRKNKEGKNMKQDKGRGPGRNGPEIDEDDEETSDITSFIQKLPLRTIAIFGSLIIVMLVVFIVSFRSTGGVSGDKPTTDISKISKDASKESIAYKKDKEKENKKTMGVGGIPTISEYEQVLYDNGGDMEKAIAHYDKQLPEGLLKESLYRGYLPDNRDLYGIKTMKIKALKGLNEKYNGKGNNYAVPVDPIRYVDNTIVRSGEFTTQTPTSIKEYSGGVLTGLPAITKYEDYTDMFKGNNIYMLSMPVILNKSYTTEELYEVHKKLAPVVQGKKGELVPDFITNTSFVGDLPKEIVGYYDRDEKSIEKVKNTPELEAQLNIFTQEKYNLSKGTNISGVEMELLSGEGTDIKGKQVVEGVPYTLMYIYNMGDIELGEDSKVKITILGTDYILVINDEFSTTYSMLIELADEE